LSNVLIQGTRTSLDWRLILLYLHNLHYLRNLLIILLQTLLKQL
jgi:hypothetical protein